jgi:hypothetical protein
MSSLHPRVRQEGRIGKPPKTVPVDAAGPTPERLAKAYEDGLRIFTIAGRSRASRLYTMLDDGLGRLWVRKKLSAEEYSALRRYAAHWVAGGLQGPLHSVDLNRIQAAGQFRGAEGAHQHRDAYHKARCAIGERPALVADRIACQGWTLAEVGVMVLGYRSVSRGRERAREILCDAAYRLGQYWRECDRKRERD